MTVLVVAKIYTPNDKTVTVTVVPIFLLTLNSTVDIDVKF